MNLRMRYFISLICFFASFFSYANNHIVSNTSDTGSGSFRHAIVNASAGDSVSFSPSLISSGNDTIILHSEIEVNEGLTIIGLVENGDTLFISGNNTCRILQVDLKNSSIKFFQALDLNLIDSKTSGSGGAIIISGADSAIFISCLFYHNVADSNGGAIFSSNNVSVYASTFLLDSAFINGGAIYCDSSDCVINGSVISSSWASGSGGGVFSDYSVRLNVSTLLRNQAGYSGGASHSQSINLHNSSILHNNSDSIEGAIHAVEASVKGSLIAFNQAGSFSGFDSAKLISHGYNILSDSLADLHITDQLNISNSELLVVETSYYGFELNASLGSGNVAINAGDPADFSTAQNSEVYGCRRDIGAIEVRDTLTHCQFTNVDVCDTVLWNGKTLRNSGVYYDTLVDQNGNDSVNVLNLTVWGATITNTQDSGFGSLRQAISCACEGDTVILPKDIISQGSATINLGSEIKINKGLVIKGAYNATDTLFISGSNTYRVFNVDLGSAASKTLILDSMAIINGRTNSSNGGGVRVKNTQKFILANSLIRGNVGSNSTWNLRYIGGGMHCEADSVVLLNNRIIRNTGYGHVDAAGIAVISAYSTIENCSFIENISNKQCGGLYIKSDSAYLFDNTFKNNKATHGSGIYFDSTFAVLRNHSFNQNISGAGALFASASNITIYKADFIENNISVAGNGGGLNAINSSISLDSSSFELNQASNGAGVYVTGSELQIANSLFRSNKASYGGGIYANGQKFEISNSVLDSNEGHYGGALFLDSDTSNLNSCTLKYNLGYNGGGVFLDTGTVTISNSDIQYNYTRSNGGSAGGVFILDTEGRTIFENCNISNNFSNNSGGAICDHSTFGGACIIRNCLIDSNESTGWHGGAIYSERDTLKISGSSISYNSADEEGGAIYHRYQKIFIDSCKINHNTCHEEGGALSLTSGTCYISNSELNYNTADKIGGAIFIDGNYFDIVNCSVSHNKAELGGGVWSDYNKNVNVVNSTFDHNTATNVSNYTWQRKGGAFYSKFDNLTIVGSTFSNNTASNFGGGLYIENTYNYRAVSITASTFGENSAVSGGAIYFDG